MRVRPPPQEVPAIATRLATYDKANDASMNAQRAVLILKGIDIIIMDRLETVEKGMPSEAAEIVWELVNIAQSIVEEVSNATSEIAFDLSGATADRRNEAPTDPRGAAPTGAV